MRASALTQIGFALLALQSAGGPTWPRIVPFSASVPVRLTVDRIAIDLPLKDGAGQERYHFACRGGREAYLDSLDGNWLGPLMCTLAEGATPREESLLSEDDGAAWFSRGQFQAKELGGDCAKYPEFGVHRSFRLRGFRLSLDARDVRVDRSGMAESFTLLVSLTDDPSARSAEAERPGFLDPRRQGADCRVVLKGSEPRMCRDRTRGGSWVPCEN
jgi:hypothetical protein